MKTLQQILSVFDDKALRSAVSVFNALKRHGYKMEDLEDEHKGTQREQIVMEKEGKALLERGKKQWEAIAPKCPDCKRCLSIKHICKKKGPENIKGYTCLWHCENGDCVYENYTYENAGEEVKKLMERRKKNGN